MEFLRLENVSFTYPKGKEEVLKGISFGVKEGQTIALMGPNGSGKTTLGKIMIGIYKPAKGKIFFEGKELSKFTLGEIGGKIGYVFQNPEKQLFSPTVEEEISFGLRFRGIDDEIIHRRVIEMLDYFDLTHRAKSFPFNLSQGEKQRLVIAATLALEPKFIIFDEPTTGLDYLRKKKFVEILEKLKNKGVGYMIISHDEAFCRNTTQQTLYLEEGKLI